MLAEAAALKAEEVAQAAMTAAETAVQEEMQADATVHETQAALEKLGTALRNMKEAGFSGTSAASAAGPAAAAAAPAAVDSVAGVASVSSLASMDGSEAPVSVSVSVEDKVGASIQLAVCIHLGVCI